MFVAVREEELMDGHWKESLEGSRESHLVPSENPGRDSDGKRSRLKRFEGKIRNISIARQDQLSSLSYDSLR